MRPIDLLPHKLDYELRIRGVVFEKKDAFVKRKIKFPQADGGEVLTFKNEFIASALELEVLLSEKVVSESPPTLMGEVVLYRGTGVQEM
ncbi:hypothetical protein ILUMI_23260 [Ignelater luminosus]|uniref:Uncharacterized protein n=1 Tax=Ignelater luminosus TaxID=2038154 RepID=A0A8K0CCC0_IGNLU|nr:hypothetical protein ILUMI_23260 [Ignelater luminosus]